MKLYNEDNIKITCKGWRKGDVYQLNKVNGKTVKRVRMNTKELVELSLKVKDKHGKANIVVRTL